jgi:hypothetical protein
VRAVHFGWKCAPFQAMIGCMHLISGTRDPGATADAAARVPGVIHAHARLTGRTLRVEVEGFLSVNATLAEADRIGRSVADALTPLIGEMGSFAWADLAA